MTQTTITRNGKTFCAECYAEASAFAKGDEELGFLHYELLHYEFAHN